MRETTAGWEVVPVPSVHEVEIGDAARVVLELNGGEGRIGLKQDVFDSEVFERKIGRITEARASSTAAMRRRDAVGCRSRRRSRRTFTPTGRPGSVR